VRVLFDTSVLVAAFVVNHPRHEDCAFWLERTKSQNIEGLIAVHTLAETYAVLTRLPLKPAISAELLIQENLENLDVVVLTEVDYQTTIERMVRLGLIGGGIYDALIAQAALNANADLLLTLNPKHFTRLGDPIARLVQEPTQH
jgi:predicted nucleic acid-binding protein